MIIRHDFNEKYVLVVAEQNEKLLNFNGRVAYLRDGQQVWVQVNNTSVWYRVGFKNGELTIKQFNYEWFVKQQVVVNGELVHGKNFFLAGMSPQMLGAVLEGMYSGREVVSDEYRVDDEIDWEVI
jgi:hypothetical protein